MQDALLEDVDEPTVGTKMDTQTTVVEGSFPNEAHPSSAESSMVEAGGDLSLPGAVAEDGTMTNVKSIADVSNEAQPSSAESSMAEAGGDLSMPGAMAEDGTNVKAITDVSNEAQPGSAESSMAEASGDLSLPGAMAEDGTNVKSITDVSNEAQPSSAESSMAKAGGDSSMPGAVAEDGTNVKSDADVCKEAQPSSTKFSMVEVETHGDLSMQGIEDGTEADEKPSSEEKHKDLVMFGAKDVADDTMVEDVSMRELESVAVAVQSPRHRQQQRRPLPQEVLKSEIALLNQELDEQSALKRGVPSTLRGLLQFGSADAATDVLDQIAVFSGSIVREIEEHNGFDEFCQHVWESDPDRAMSAYNVTM